MRQGIRDLVELVAKTLPVLEPIYEFGAWQSQPAGFSDLRTFFSGRTYVGCDIREGPGVDRILDLHDTGLPSESVGTVLLLEVMEHVQFPMKALEEVHRILKTNGMVVMSSQMNYPIHDTHDYWRFTPEGFLTLLRAFPCAFVESAGDPSFPPAVIGVGVKGEFPASVSDGFRRKVGEWRLSWDRGGAAESFEGANLERRSWKGTVKLFAPPVLLTLYRKLK